MLNIEKEKYMDKNKVINIALNEVGYLEKSLKGLIL